MTRQTCRSVDYTSKHITNVQAQFVHVKYTVVPTIRTKLSSNKVFDKKNNRKINKSQSFH